MSDIPNDDIPGFVAEKPEHCFACYRLIKPGQTYYLTIEGIVYCEDCALSAGVIPVAEDLAVEVKRDRLLIQRGAQVGEGAHRLLGPPSTTPTPVLCKDPLLPFVLPVIHTLHQRDDLLQQRRPNMETGSCRKFTQ